mmetsp:Transcript_5649/g.10783  ORF Transcript_5649/g.10783 Transcript_5649/m.10783 type:complete len:214 (-) Transcript_5649:82-723(-)|eukprot:CAMPEP_0175141164 /NCGR_PEP_ID=MMETSP0087-20121206/11942_1 /TAXON_ID=136419 /ORGANISM="Unknown Unknown, Strain D1" /LENGTH=213 /DNA_ID=CAMNT_0016424527 /DNA_START=26 /DNA_END=667 /DNA_ORIENTATION=-
MGICFSNDPVDPAPARAPPPPATAPAASVQDVQVQLNSPTESEADFKLVLHQVVVLACQKVCMALQYEKEAYLELAKRRGFSSYIDLMAPHHFEQALRATFDIGEVPEPATEANDINFEQMKFLNFLEVAKAAKFQDWNISRGTLIERFQSACTKTQQELQASADQADASDLKLHLYFFINCLNIIQGDMTPGNLFKNIETFVDNKPVGKALL